VNTELPFTINKRILAVLGILVLLLIIPVTVLFLNQTQQIRQNAAGITPSWIVAKSAEALCSSGTVAIQYSFTNNDPSFGPMNVVVKDNQSGKSVNLGSVSPGQTKTGQIDTGLSTAQNGILFFILTGKGSSDTKTVSYNALQCASSTPTPTPLVCQANQSTCSWDTNPNATKYIYKVTEKNSNTPVAQGTVNTPQTSVSFPSVAGKSYICEITPLNECSTGTSGKGEFNCAIPTPTPSPLPTPTACVVPNQPTNVSIICPNCLASASAVISPFWRVALSANASCPAGAAVIVYSFTNNDPSFGPMKVVAKDNQSGKSVNLGSVSPGQTKTGQINTGLTSLKDGTISFKLTAKGSSDTKKASYKGVQCSLPLPSPSVCPSVGTVNNVTISCLTCSGQ